MGFEDMTEDTGVTPIDGVLDLPLPKTLDEAARGISDAHSIRANQDRAKQLVASNADLP